MNKKEPQNCWNFMNCPPKTKANCEVFKLNSGRECWFLMNTKQGCPASKKYGSCVGCPWYKKLNPDNK